MANPTARTTTRPTGPSTREGGSFKRTPAQIPNTLEPVSAPSTSARSRLAYLPLMEQAIEQPGQWFRLASYAGKTVAQTVAVGFRQGRKQLPEDTGPSDWEFGADSSDDGSELKFRYVGAPME